MWLPKFLNTISRLLPNSLNPGVEKALAELDPDKIYIENVRSVLNVSPQMAFDLCETAVGQGFFTRGVEVLCPDGAVAASAESETELPPTVNCWTEENGHIEEVELPTDKLQKITFYKLNDEEAAVLFR